MPISNRIKETAAMANHIPASVHILNRIFPVRKSNEYVKMIDNRQQNHKRVILLLCFLFIIFERAPPSSGIYFRIKRNQSILFRRGSKKCHNKPNNCSKNHSNKEAVRKFH